MGNGKHDGCLAPAHMEPSTTDAGAHLRITTDSTVRWHLILKKYEGVLNVSLGLLHP